MEVLKSPFNIMKGLFFVTVISKSFNLISKSTTQTIKGLKKNMQLFDQIMNIQSSS